MKCLKVILLLTCILASIIFYGQEPESHTSDIIVASDIQEHDENKHNNINTVNSF